MQTIRLVSIVPEKTAMKIIFFTGTNGRTNKGQTVYLFFEADV